MVRNNSRITKFLEEEIINNHNNYNHLQIMLKNKISGMY